LRTAWSILHSRGAARPPPRGVAWDAPASSVGILSSGSRVLAPSSCPALICAANQTPVGSGRQRGTPCLADSATPASAHSRPTAIK
jgi:hypothetical protein